VRLRRRTLAVLVAAVALGAAWAKWHRGGGLYPACARTIEVQVPTLEALPALLAVSRPASGPACRLVPPSPGRPATWEVVPGQALLQAPGHSPSLVGIALVAQRVGAVLVSRRPTGPHFLWHDLEGQVVLLPSVPGDLGAAVVRAAVAQHRVQGVRLLTGLGPRAFAAGTGAYLEVPLEMGMVLRARRQGYVACHLGVQAGPLPAAVLAVSPGYLARHPQAVRRMVLEVAWWSLALGHGQSPPPNTGVAPLPPAALREARRIRLWPQDVRLDEALFTRLQALLAAAGLPPSPGAQAAWWSGPAEWAMRHLGEAPYGRPAVGHE
jgi:hypothetical protein